MNSEQNTSTARGAKAPVQNLAYGLFGRKVEKPQAPAPKQTRSQELSDQAA